MSAKKLPSAAYLKRRLLYDSIKGTFTWRPRPIEHFDGDKRAWAAWNGKFAGQLAGSLRSNGYWAVRVDDVLYFGHRLAWKMITGEDPVEQVDHVNGDPADNRFSNLRLASNMQNSHNMAMSSRNTSGVKGVSWNARRNQYQAYVNIDGKRTHVGWFADIDSAAKAVKRTRKRLHREFARNA